MISFTGSAAVGWELKNNVGKKPIALELIVEVRVRVDLEDRERPVAGAEPAQNRIRDRVIAAEGDERQ